MHHAPATCLAAHAARLPVLQAEQVSPQTQCSASHHSVAALLPYYLRSNSVYQVIMLQIHTKYHSVIHSK